MEKEGAHTVGVSKRAGSFVLVTARRMRVPASTKNAGMSTTKAHIFLSRLNVRRRFLSKAARCCQNRGFEGLDRSMSGAPALPSPVLPAVDLCLSFRSQKKKELIMCVVEQCTAEKPGASANTSEKAEGLWRERGVMWSMGKRFRVAPGVGP